jgi:hypothetical protein
MTRHGCNATTCPNLKCRTTGECIDALPRVESPPLVPLQGPMSTVTADQVAYCHELADGRRAAWRNDPAIKEALHRRPPRSRLIDTDSATRKTFPMARGLLDYFPDALAEVAKVSYIGNEKHNPGEEMHHARGKSMDHADCIIRHLVGRGGFDGDTRESAALAWRALALLQEELEREMGLPLPRAARA